MTSSDYHLSVSAINDFCHCGERWRLKHDEGLREPETRHTITGTSLHRAVAENMRHKKKTGRLMLASDVSDVAASSVRTAFQVAPVLLTGDDGGRPVTVVQDDIVDVAVMMARCHHSEVAPAITPVDIEERATLEVPGLPPIVTVMDLTDAAGNIRDTKTSSRAPARDAADKSLQLTQYQITYRALHGKEPTGLVLDNLVHRKATQSRPLAKVEYARQAVPPRNRDTVQGYLDRVVAVDASIKAGIAVPADVNSWKCSPRFCGFFGDACRYTRGMKPREDD